MEFSPHAISYLDILGFSMFIEEAETNQDKLVSLDKLFNEVISRNISLGDRQGDYFKTMIDLKFIFKRRGACVLW